MGCQNSRLVNTDILAIPPKLRPLLWRKVEEMRRRRGGATAESTLSKKELLTSEAVVREESEAFSHQSVRENESSSPDDLNSVSSSESQPKSSQQENNNIVSEETNEAERTHAKEDEKQEKDDRDNDREDKEEKEDKNDYNNKIDEEKEEEEEDCDEERNIGPGSPSFRVYYIESLVEKKKDHVEEDIQSGNKNEETKDENVDDIQKKCSRESSVDSIVVMEDQEPIEEQEAKMGTKRGKNRMRITRAICRGPVAMKNLLHVTSCYHPNNERASLLAKKIDP